MPDETRDSEDMPRSFWRFNIGHALTILGLIGGFLWAASGVQTVITNLQAATLANAGAVATVEKDLRQYRDERSRIDERTASSLAKIQADVAYIKGRSDRTELVVPEQNGARTR